jgi:DNA-binding transcriptional LysR family regulator
LAKDPFIVATNYPTHNLHDTMLRVCREAGFAPNVRYSADSVFGAVSMVSAKLGVAMVYEIPGYHPPEIVYKKITGVAMGLRMQISWKHGQLTPTAANFLRLR